MHEHDFDLIAAIAEGSMVPEEAAAAEATLVQCPSCREELSLQRYALAALKAAPSPVLSDLERARIHRAVESAVAERRPGAVRRPAAPWYQRLVPVMAAAAALLVVVGIGSVLSNGEQADQAVDTTAAGAAPADQERAALEPEPTLALDTAEVAAEDAEGLTTTTLAASYSPPVVVELGSITEEELSGISRDYFNARFEQAPAAPSAGEQADEQSLLCAEAAETYGVGAQMIATATVDGQAVEIYFLAEVAYVFETPDCTLTATFE